jgi:hypothetical protein
VVVALVLEEHAVLRPGHVDATHEEPVLVVHVDLELRFGETGADDHESAAGLLWRSGPDADEVERGSESPSTPTRTVQSEHRAQVLDRRTAGPRRDDSISEHHEVVEPQQCAALDPQRRRSAGRHAPALPDHRARGISAVPDDVRPPHLCCRADAGDVHSVVVLVLTREREFPEPRGRRVADELPGQQDRSEGTDPRDALRRGGAAPADGTRRAFQVVASQALPREPGSVGGTDVERASPQRGW